MRRALALIFLFAPLAAVAQTGCPASFDYSGFQQPSQWQYIADWRCATGPQSPIDVSGPFASERNKTIAVHYPTMKLTVANSGYDFRVMPTLSGWISFPGVARAVLVQFHFHVPSEHTLNGQPQTAGEIHFLNVDSVTGRRYVIAVLLRADAVENPALQPIFNQLPLHLCQKRITTIDFASILPSTAVYVAAILP